MQDARAHFLPGFTGRLAAHHAPGTRLDFARPCSFDLRRCGGWRLFQAGQQFRRNVGSLLRGQGQGFTKQGLRSGGHAVILDPIAQPNNALREVEGRTAEPGSGPGSPRRQSPWGGGS